MAKPTNLKDEALIALDNLRDTATSMSVPTVRIGVTGLSRAGKTIFITSLIHNLLHNGRLPLFSALAQGRLIGAQLAEQPDDTVPRFAYEDHIKALTGKARKWPESTHQISQVRLTLKYHSTKFLGNVFGPKLLHLDIVDYPGEWLLDLPLLTKDYQTWSNETFAMTQSEPRKTLAKAWLKATNAQDPLAEMSEPAAKALHQQFTDYLHACRADEHALSTVPPGRFLMPGDLEGSPALTFAPLPDIEGKPPKGSLYAMMARRFEAYKKHIVKPFYRDHFARLDRQIVLVDTMQALNAGPGALSDLEQALADILGSFRPGTNNVLSRLVARHIDRILFAATKADHLHHSEHDQLQNILSRLVEKAEHKARFSGAKCHTIALANLRATREGTVKQGKQTLDCIIGTPQKGEEIDGKIFDGTKEIALFPGDLPKDLDSLFHNDAIAKAPQPVNFLRFRPPEIATTSENGKRTALPHIRLDRALEFLIGDKLQ